MSSKKNLLIYSNDFKLHSPEPYFHPENPERLDKMLHGLEAYALINNFEKKEPPTEPLELFLKVHDKDYYNYVISKGRKSTEWLDNDTYISPGTYQALKRLAGSATMILKVINDYKRIILLPRPPGHHAGRKGRGLRAPTLGFCIFNISALIAEMLKENGLKVSMLDFDAHHGNGTQDIFYSDKNVLHVDIHQDSSTIYPGTGYPKECGVDEAYGTKININIPPLAGDDVFIDASERAIEHVNMFKPDILLVDAGFDGYNGDNYMVSLRLSSHSFYTIGKYINDLISTKTIMVVVEGGYDLGLLKGLPAFISGLLDLSNPVDDDKFFTSTSEVWDLYKRRLKELEECLS